MQRAALVLDILVALAFLAILSAPAAGAKTHQRCCFFLTADSDAEVKETFKGDTPRGKQEGAVAWKLVGVFKYREQGGFADLVHVGPSHEHGIRYTKDEIRSYLQLQEPPDTVGMPVATPGTCGIFKRKSVERSPRVSLFRAKVAVYVSSYEDDGCMYGLSMIDWSVNSGPEGYGPWGDEFRAPPRNFFRHGRGTYRRSTGFHSTYSPLHDYGVDAEYDHTGFLRLEWFPPRALDDRLQQIRRYHQHYDFGDLCSHVPCG
jgi:hypothetical protein